MSDDFILGNRAPFTSAEQSAVNTPDEFNYQIWKLKVVALIQAWNGELLETDRRRRQRKIEVNLDLLRKQGRLKADESFLAIRVIDENIRREQPVFMNYLRQPSRMAVFKNDQVPIELREQLEDEVTTGLQYSGWDLDYYGVVDGAQLHAWDAMEVMFDDSKPFKVSNEHIGHDDLLFPLDAIDIQACAFILRRYKFTPMLLESMVEDFGFSDTQCNLALQDSRNQSNIIPKNIDIWKILFKIKKVVYVAWIEKDRCSDWLKAPVPLDLGRKKYQTQTEMVPSTSMSTDMETGQPVPVTTSIPRITGQWIALPESLYPIKILRYSQTEEKPITEQKGRAFYDLPYQEAATALSSLFVNGCVRASNVYASSEKGTGTGSIPKKADTTLEHGCVYNEPIKFWNPPYPDPMILKGLSFIDVRKQQESGNLAAAVINREDSRKTAKEMDVAENQTDAVKSVQLILFSNFMREILTFDWHIIQNLALQGLIPLLQQDIPITDIYGQTTGSEPKNDYDSIQKEYDISAAGDIDVVKRQERVQRRMMLMPMVQALPELAAAFMKDLLKEMLPEDADKYCAIIDSAMMNKDQMILSLAAMLKEAVTNPDGSLKPEFQSFAPQLQQIGAMVQQMQASNAAPSRSPGRASNTQPQQSSNQHGPSPQGQMNMQTNNMMASQSAGGVAR